MKSGECYSASWSAECIGAERIVEVYPLAPNTIFMRRTEDGVSGEAQRICPLCFIVKKIRCSGGLRSALVLISAEARRMRLRLPPPPSLSARILAWIRSNLSCPSSLVCALKSRLSIRKCQIPHYALG